MTERRPSESMFESRPGFTLDPLRSDVAEQIECCRAFA